MRIVVLGAAGGVGQPGGGSCGAAGAEVVAAARTAPDVAAPVQLAVDVRDGTTVASGGGRARGGAVVRRGDPAVGR